MLFQKPSLRTRVTFEAGMAQLGGHAIYLTDDVVLGARESVRDVARNLERFVDAIVVRTGPHEVVARARRAGRHPGHQRPDPARAPVPGAGRRVHDPASGSGDLARRCRRVRRRRQQRLPLAGAARARRSGWRSASPIRPGYAPNERIVARAHGARGGVGRAARLRRTTRSRSSAAPRSSTPTPGPRWARRPRPRSAATRSPATRSTTPCSTRPGPDARRDALPAGASRRGDHLGGDGRTA